ncbi:Iron-enterobactin transporter ATP-binding protein [Candidatus Nitrotoga sp. HW29]|uniref:ABC transporter ATP-binding protein n=1 Tax=Candidatus Nitrotoga sp. HW29 TaxID=2886963 RepID=UPI001EF2BD28|nr:ABC transporter ATP-binding protein [Candidatus Nitrotoga sp. HW29]CAH1906396.1 Iron-enterobactin transporter ATP-binding protein [Candidatus Nitrotoga sp. HW29]
MQAFLEARKLTVAIGAKMICHELDLVVRPGECWGVLGQNGVGKTTLLRTLAGLHMPQSGMVSWNGVVLTAQTRRNLARHLGVLLQNEGGEFWGSVQEYVLLGRFPHRASLFGYSVQDEALAQQALAQMELEGLAQQPYNTLSGGEQQRAAIAQTLAQQVQCYLLDEPLQHLDLRHQAQTMQVFSRLKEQGCALMMVLHDTLWAQRCCDHVLMQFADGHVLHGTAQELLTRTHLEALYQCSLRELSVEGERWFVAGV